MSRGGARDRAHAPDARVDVVAFVSCGPLAVRARGGDGGRTHNGSRDVAVERPARLGRVFTVLVAELLV